MKLSFVIPARNEEAYIGKCLDSIFRELRKEKCDAEIIVVDNGSTDRTAQIAERYSGVKVVKEPVKGLPRTRARGLREAKGELIANIDADAELPPGWIRKVLREFSDDPELVCLSGPHVYHDLSAVIRFLVKIFYAITFFFYLINRFVLNVCSVVQGGNFVCRKDALVSAGGFDSSIDFYGEDTDIARRLHKLGHVKFTLGLPIYVSGRRLAKEGIFTIAGRYAINYFWIVFFKKPYTRTSIDVRLNENANRLRYSPGNKKTEILIGTVSLGVMFLIIAGISIAAYILIRAAL